MTGLIESPAQTTREQISDCVIDIGCRSETMSITSTET